MQFINCTSHEIRLRSDESNVLEPLDTDIVFGPTEAARVIWKEVTRYAEDGNVPVVQYIFDGVAGLPDPQYGVKYIVSTPVAQQLAGSRNDVISPNTWSKDSIRYGENGKNIYAVRSFQTFSL